MVTPVDSTLNTSFMFMWRNDLDGLIIAVSGAGPQMLDMQTRRPTGVPSTALVRHASILLKEATDLQREVAQIVSPKKFRVIGLLNSSRRDMPASLDVLSGHILCCE